MKKILILCLFILAVKGFAGETYITPDNENLYYEGRFDYSNPKEIVYDFPGSAITIEFESKNLNILINDNKNYFNVFVDDQKPVVFKFDKDKDQYQIAKDLKKGKHKVRIVRRTEAQANGNEAFTHFKGFVLDEKSKLYAAEIKSRKIEFVGNSITCGYGDEGDSPTCHFSLETENASMSYASMIADYFGAEARLNAYSGRGMVRNYGDTVKISKEPMTEIYNRTCVSNKELMWDFSKWKPSVVVINLGTNDYSTHPFPDEYQYTQAYINFINKVRKNYGNVPIVCVCGPMINEPCFTYVKKVVEFFRANKDEKIYFGGIDTGLLAMPDDYGCDYHPNIKGQNKIAKTLIPLISSVTGWELK